jgi:hypothetical protein
VTHDDIIVPVNFAEFGLALVVVMAIGVERQFDVALAVDRVRRILLTDEILAALGVALAQLTAVNASHTLSGPSGAESVFPEADKVSAARWKAVACFILMLAVAKITCTSYVCIY